MLCDGAVIGAGATVGRGTTVSFNCVIAPGHSVPPYSRITLCGEDASAQDEDSDVELEAPTGRTTTLDDDDEDAAPPGPSSATLQVRFSSRLPCM
jgi:carbonic anhydrase/acetyltransferase-like protein (isoleucine patch superfamily)